MDTKNHLWEQEFGAEYAIPQEILDLHAADKLFDYSWHNDIRPSFGRNNEKGEVRLWVDHPDPKEREVGPDGKRFSVVFYPDEGGADTAIDTDRVIEAIEVFRVEILRRLGIDWNS
jgi:hypothetical protein